MKRMMLLLSAAILTASCTQKGGAPDADTKHVITVTLEPLRYFAEQIAGEHFRVVSMVPEGSSPETYDPTPQQLVDLADSKAYLRIGHIGFEQDSLNRVIAQTDSTVRTLLNHKADRAFLIYHPALSYFARYYKLEQICLEEGGKEPSAAHLKQLIGQCRKKGVNKVFIQKEFDSRNAELAAKETGAVTVVINPLNYRWDEELILTAKALQNE